MDGTTVVLHVDHKGAAYPVVADPAIQANCGWTSCTLRLDRAQTRNARDAAAVGMILGSACFLTGAAAGWCGFAVAISVGPIALAAARVYESGNCLSVTFNYFGGHSLPLGSVKRGTYNCK